MSRNPVARAATSVAALAALAALTVACGATPHVTGQPGRTSAPEAAPPQVISSLPPTGPALPPATGTPEAVRDAFAGLQATLGGSCTPGECAYFLGRVHDELHRLDRAMKADPKGPGHFPVPVGLIRKLDAELAGDRSFKNLKKHQNLLFGTRDKINLWMQDHPDDYR